MSQNQSLKSNSVIIADDSQLFCLGLEVLIKKVNASLTILSAVSSFEILSMFCIQHSKFIFMDVSMPSMDFVQTTNEIKKIDDSVKIIGLTSMSNRDNSTCIYNACVNGFLCKDDNMKNVEASLCSIFNAAFLNTNSNPYNLDGKKTNIYLKLKGDLREELTQREIEILILICQQLSTKEISEQLKLSPKTIDIHRGHIMEKTHSKNMIGLVLYAIEKNNISHPKVA